MRVFLLAAAFLAPSAAFACAMPHYDEKELARVMQEIDAAAAPEVKAPAKPEQPAATVDAPSTIPEAQPAKAPAKSAKPTAAPRS